ncbi:MAG: hypothetical protein K2X99_02040 [Gemmatimonadaceae bacterium]|nr:hypothetical protein [Gemmatimonadaceae bacterium]
MRALVIGCVATLGVWTTAARLAPPAPALPTPALQNAIAVERLVRGAHAPRVLVLGSSLAARVPSALIGDDAMVIGLSGGSGAAAVALADAAGVRPTVAIVELQRLGMPAPNGWADSLVRAARSDRRARVAFFDQEHRPATLALSAIARTSARVRRWLSTESQRRETEARAAHAYGPVADAASDTAFAEAQRRLTRWREQGTRVYLIELPVHEASAITPTLRAAIDRAFPASEFPRVAHPPGGYPTSDGRHLEPEAAARVAQAIAVAALSEPRYTPR